MLTAKQNMQEVIRGGKPERFVNQYEAVQLLQHPFSMFGSSRVQRGGPDVVNAWGVTNSYPAHVPGPFPLHTPEKIVVKDIETWREYVKAPPLKFTDEQWAMAKEQYDAIDGSQSYKAAFVAPGLFEQTHHLCEITEALTYYMTDPDEMRDMVKYLTDWELELAEGICKHLKPDAVFHHDDWGSEISTFLNPDMFAEYFVEPYKQIYGYYHNNGVELIIHHNDSYSATIVPYMIEMGIDIWQGCMKSNNIPELINKYGGQISFMGGLDNKLVDFTGWTQEDVRKVVRETLSECGNKYFIPCITQGGPGSLYKGTYIALAEEIDRYSMEVYGIKENDITRLPLQIVHEGD
ncbi:MAG: uroporphyrinogen decarboxylase [Oscillospiraceae bacterium]|nr:uroporphyrinogen decarboxylase [Oscillospiraceae bacterium]